METQPNQRSLSAAVLYTGCRSSTARQGRGKGIGIFALAGPRQLIALGERATPENPSYLAFGRRVACFMPCMAMARRSAHTR